MKSEKEIRQARNDLEALKNSHLAKATDANDEGLQAIHNEMAVEADTKIEALEWVLGDINKL